MDSVSSTIPSRRFSVLTERMRGLMAKITLSSYLIGMTTSVLLGSGYLAFAQGSQTQTTTTTYATVERGTLLSTVKAVGKVTFASEQTLKFNQKGTVKKVNFSEGDTVKKGRVIAEIDSVSAQADVQQSALSLSASKLQLEQLHKDYEKQALSAKNAVNSAERDLSQSKLDLQKTQETELQTLAGTAQDILIASEKLLDSFYGVLTRDAAARPPNYDTTFEFDRLLYRDWNLKSEVELAFRSGVNQANDMNQKYGTTLRTEQDPDTILAALQDAQELAESLQTLGERTYTMMQGAVTDSIEFPAADLTTLRNTVNTNRSTAAGLVDDARTAQSNLVALLKKEDSLPSITLQTKEDTVTKYEEADQQKKADRESTLAGLDITIRLKENDIAQKGTSLTKLRKTLEDYRLTAPFEGVITHIDYKVGDNLLDTGDTESLTLQNPGFLLITIPLDQVDVVRVHKDMPSHIVFDAIPGQTFEGAIDKIDSTAITTSGVVSYNVSVKLSTPKDLTILSGMTATVTIETAKKENVLVVPNLALRSQNGSVSVQKASGETVTVETGMTDGRKTEVISGVSEGDSILAMNLGTAASSSSINTQQVMRGLGGLGGGGPPR